MTTTCHAYKDRHTPTTLQTSHKYGQFNWKKVQQARLPAKDQALPCMCLLAHAGKHADVTRHVVALSCYRNLEELKQSKQYSRRKQTSVSGRNALSGSISLSLAKYCFMLMWISAASSCSRIAHAGSKDTCRGCATHSRMEQTPQETCNTDLHNTCTQMHW